MGCSAPDTQARYFQAEGTAIVHTHPPYCSALSVTGQPLGLIFASGGLLGWWRWRRQSA
jgi:ribulose-5-phosphate 4-epimerase/fuculose-1-phosphate aldolase